MCAYAKEETHPALITISLNSTNIHSLSLTYQDAKVQFALLLYQGNEVASTYTYGKEKIKPCDVVSAFHLNLLISILY